VTDNGSPPLSASRTFSVTVNEVNSAPSLAAIADQVISELAALTLTNSATDADVPAQILTYSLTNAPAGATINPTNGIFTWTPGETDGPGTNSITVRVTDNGSPPLSASRTFSVIVNEVNSAPVLTAISDRTIHAGAILNLTNSAADPDIPANTLAFSLDPGAPAGASINSSNGVFTWATQPEDANTTNAVTVRVTDDGTPPLNDTKSFVVTVVAPPLQSISLSNNVVTIAWSAIAGEVYRVQYSEELPGTNWIDLPPDVTAPGSVASKDDSLGSAAQRFYRVLVVP
jgi:hypothetical protein